MKNKLLIMLITITVFGAFAQNKKVTRTGSVQFLSKTPIENIAAQNNQVASILLVNEKQIAFNVLMKSFKFEKALMEEHFNEKYVHSNKFPAAKFKGSIPPSVALDKAHNYEGVEINGQMLFHGVKKPLIIIANIEVKEDLSISFSSSFNLKLEDYDIKVPSLVKDKISEQIKISVATNYK